VQNSNLGKMLLLCGGYRDILHAAPVESASMQVEDITIDAEMDNVSM